jgi:preprotein translocase subunit Sec63
MKRFRQLSLHFHPDKALWLMKEHKSVGFELFNLIQKQKENLINQLEK